MILLPDPLYSLDRHLGAAAFLWFGDVTITLPPTVVTHESLQVLDRLNEGGPTPAWCESLRTVLGGWRTVQEGASTAREALAPLQDRVQRAWLVYSADSDAMSRARELIAGVGLKHEDLVDAIDVPAACGELARHLFLERWLEVDKDYDKLWDACAYTLDPGRFRERLVEAYLLRLSAFPVVPTDFALTNVRLLDFLWRCWSLAGEPQASHDQSRLASDAVGYEIFRHLVSPHLDPLHQNDAARTTARLLESSSDEIGALRRQCLRLAEKIPAFPLTRLEAEVSRFIELHVHDEVAAVLNLNGRALQEYMASISSDRMTWVAMLTTLAGAAEGNAGFTLAGGVGVAATLLSKGATTSWQAHKELRDSPYRVIRSIIG